jgi:hypothetical protein
VDELTEKGTIGTAKEAEIQVMALEMEKSERSLGRRDDTRTQEDAIHSSPRKNAGINM